MSLNLSTCRVCEEGQLILHTEDVWHSYKDAKKLISHEYYECNECGCVKPSIEQSRQNKRTMIAFQKEVDGMLSGAEVRVIRKTYGLSIEDAGKIFGGGPVAFSKYENDDLVQSQPMDAALRLAQSSKPAFLQLVKVKHPELIERLIEKLKQGIVAQSDHSWRQMTAKITESTVVTVPSSRTSNPSFIVPINFNEDINRVYS